MLPEPVTLFLDYDQGGKVIPQILEQAGVPYARLQDHFDKKTPDNEWIPECAKRGWLIITSDKGIESDPVNRYSVIDSGAKVVILDDNNSRGCMWGAALVVSRSALYEFWATSEDARIISLKSNGNLTYRKRPVLREWNQQRKAMGRKR